MIAVMSYFPDLSPYDYCDNVPGLINIGWLDRAKPFPTGTVDTRIITKIGELCKSPQNLLRGFHRCPWCDEWPVQEAYIGDGQLLPLGNGEIRVNAGGIYWTYAAPTLIYHYILRHRYLPPMEFLDAVELLID
jgi:hypothetical protein